MVSRTRRAGKNRERVRDTATSVPQRAVERASREELLAGLPDRPMLTLLDDHQLRNVALMVRRRLGRVHLRRAGHGQDADVDRSIRRARGARTRPTCCWSSPRSRWSASGRPSSAGSPATSTASQSSKAAGAAGRGARLRRRHRRRQLRGRRRAANDLRLLAGRSRVVLAVDESFNVKNPEAARTAAVGDLREWCVRCFALCGTPAPNSPRDLVAQVDLVDFGYTFAGVDSPMRPTATAL